MVVRAKRQSTTELARPFNKHIKKTDDTSESQQTEIPYLQLLRMLDNKQPTCPQSSSSPTVVYWMRMRDLRLSDNRALAAASQVAKEGNGYLVVLHVLSPGDYRAHDRSPRRIDFVLRNLIELREKLHKLEIPLYTVTMEPRKQIPERVIELMKGWGARYLYGNIEHEVDELRRDIKVLKLAAEHDVEVNFLHDTCLVEPGKVLTKEHKPYAVFSPWQRNWASIVNSKLFEYVDSAGDCGANPKSIRENETLSKLFDSNVPLSIPGFELSKEDAQKMKKYWKAGEEASQELLEKFINLPSEKTESKQTTLSKTGAKIDSSKRRTVIADYSTLRNRPDLPGTSQLSAYLAAGVISPRACIRASLGLKANEKSNKSHKLIVDKREVGAGMWQSELGWRDFYQHVLAAWPRVSMGKAFLEKYESMVWEYDDKKFQAWKDGLTGYPFIDACMRQLKELGYMHNRGRMCVAMFLTKDLMMDWRLGEKWFMENLVDGDLGSNNGGWQWSSSTGVDPQPYFRIFAPLAQSEKSDPNGDFIRRYVPELKNVLGKAIHEPWKYLPPEKFKALGYPEPIVDHAIARKRALARYKMPGSSANE